MKKTAVCLGISLALKLLCARLNVETIVTRGGPLNRDAQPTRDMHGILSVLERGGTC